MPKIYETPQKKFEILRMLGIDDDLGVRAFLKLVAICLAEENPFRRSDIGWSSKHARKDPPIC